MSASRTVILRDTAERFLAANYDYRKFRQIADSEAGLFRRTIWKQFAEMGWLGLPFSEDDGGLGMGAVEVVHADGDVSASRW